MRSPPDDEPAAAPGSALEVWWAFLRLGLTSFGGPVAHLGYFQTEFVQRRRWLDAAHYAELVALCQFLPGPTSSQVGLALGLQRAGWRGALCAWLGFTLPSALLMLALAAGVAGTGALTGAVVHGLKLVAVAIVAQAVWGMARQLCPDWPRAALAALATLVALRWPGPLGQVGAIVLAALLARWALRLPQPPAGPPLAIGITRPTGLAALALYGLALLALPLLAGTSGSPLWQAIDGVFRAGALVFGGGHVVLPLLQASVVSTGLVAQDLFLAGYGAAQALPGPLFSFAAYLGAVMQGPLSGWRGGLVLLLVLFTPALLVLLGALPFWARWRQRPGMRAALAGVNAAVVGLLLAALWDPVARSAIHGPADAALACVAFALLLWGRCSPVLVVALGALAGWWLG